MEKNKRREKIEIFVQKTPETVAAQLKSAKAAEFVIFLL